MKTVLNNISTIKEPDGGEILRMQYDIETSAGPVKRFAAVRFAAGKDDIAQVLNQLDRLTREIQGDLTHFRGK